ncbi:MAG: tRNA (N(6)-L-threonylcarbamoyladenosine(37)-C(2))-methylthiotransferase MtaB [Bacteroidales bacterium]|nr:tRNA (N(6)-L-threonylcarbamoyladenosine(37)-C(2))-methylthiotransferase MtaB [Bacteroidales bacterium]
MKKTKIAFNTFGCKLNFSETSSISKKFNKDKYQIVNFNEKADIYIIHSCSVTANAERKCRFAIHQANKKNPEAKIALMGCYAELHHDDLLKIQGVDIVLGNVEKYNIVDYIEKNKILKTIPDVNKTESFHPAYSLGDRTRSFFKVQDGCDNFCTYCIIPYARGRSRSNTIDETIKTAKEIAATEIKEIILTGVNIGDFGRKNGESFLGLIKELDKIKGIDRIRISSIEPDLLSDEIIEFVAKSKKILNHFHIPLQSGSDKILKQMHRKYDTEFFSGRIKKIKSLMPEACIAIDLITGFPGESDEDFQQTYNFLNNLELSYLHVFTYSDRPGTVAAKIKDKVNSKIKKFRSKELHILSDNKKKEFYKQNIGNKSKVLFESGNIDGYMHGFTENYIKVKTKYNPDLVNKIIDVELKDIDKEGIFVFNK